MKRLFAALAAAVIGLSTVLTPAFAAHPRAGVSLTGSGSSFDFPFFDSAFRAYQKKNGVSVNYQPLGSGAGIAAFTAKTVDFGASDVPMNPISELPKAVAAGGKVLQIPITIGGVSIAYNVPGVKSGLHLSGDVIANIYLGRITSWNSSAIRALNKKVHLPNLHITVVHRSDSSGTSYIFSDYLAAVSDYWRSQVGVSKLPNWPVGVGGNHNQGVAATVQQTPGAIGYVELAYVVQTHMHQAMVQNRAGKYVFPSPTTVSAAAAAFSNVSAEHFSIVDLKGKKSYPITGYSWALLYKHYSDSGKAKALKKLFAWMLQGGQTYAKKLEYAPLPKSVVKRYLKQVNSIT